MDDPAYSNLNSVVANDRTKDQNMIFKIQSAISESEVDSARLQYKIQRVLYATPGDQDMPSLVQCAIRRKLCAISGERGSGESHGWNPCYWRRANTRQSDFGEHGEKQMSLWKVDT